MEFGALIAKRTEYGVLDIAVKGNGVVYYAHLGRSARRDEHAPLTLKVSSQGC